MPDYLNILEKTKAWARVCEIEKNGKGKEHFFVKNLSL
jgi:hypothetical protein